MFVEPAYTFFEDGVTGTIQLRVVGQLRGDATVVVTGGMYYLQCSCLKLCINYPT